MSSGGLPITVTVTDRGVTIEGRGSIVSSNMFSERAKRLAQSFGPGEHVIATFVDAQDLPSSDWLDICDALS